MLWLPGSVCGTQQSSLRLVLHACVQRAATRHGSTEAELLWLFSCCCAPQVRSLNYMRTKVKEPSEDCIYRWGGNIISR